MIRISWHLVFTIFHVSPLPDLSPDFDRIMPIRIVSASWRVNPAPTYARNNSWVAAAPAASPLIGSSGPVSSLLTVPPGATAHIPDTQRFPHRKQSDEGT